MYLFIRVCELLLNLFSDLIGLCRMYVKQVCQLKNIVMCVSVDIKV